MRQPILPVPVAMLVMVFLAAHLPGLALGCGGVIMAAPPGVIASDGTGGFCNWTLHADIDNRILLQITEMIGCIKIFDVYSGDNFLIGTYCNVALPAILSSSSSLYINTSSNDDENDFSALYSQIGEQTLGCDLELTGSSGQFQSPDADDDHLYEINAHCFWLIRPDTNRTINLTIDSMVIENADECVYDGIKVYDGDSDEAPLIGTYCGTVIPPPFISSSSALFVTFYTDSTGVRSGFNASYRALGPVDGEWGPWDQWGGCSKTCGQGTRTRTRYCDSPQPADGGADCMGDSGESETCLLLQCPVHGAWGTWDQWGDCSKTCGQGTRMRTRQCDSPVPLYGGDDCTGDHAEYNPCYCQECHEESVPVKDCAAAFSRGEDLCGDNSRCKNTKYGHKCQCCKDYKWNKATGQCEAAPGANENRPCCGDCQHDKCNITGKVCSKDRKEYDSVAELVLDRCQKGYGPGKELAIKNYGPCEGPVTPWSEWGPCSLTCGKGLKMKTRNATKELSKKNQKKFPLTKTAYCYNAPCPGCPSCNETCRVNEVCEVVNGAAMCRCCSCTNDESDKVCGRLAGGSSETYSSLCVLQRTACIMGVGFQLISPEPCPTECSLLTKHGFYTMERNGSTYTTTVAVSYTACEGDCENGKDCSESRTEEKELSFSCASGQTMTQLVVPFPTSCCCP